MSSIRKWIASKMFPPMTSGSGQQSAASAATESGIPFFRSMSRSSPSGASSTTSTGYLHPPGVVTVPELNTQETASEQSYFATIYSHYKGCQQQTSNILTEQRLLSDMYQFVLANEELNYISTELDTFDGRKDTDRCSTLVNNLKLAQDRVITLIFRIMDQLGCERASREYRLKFPDELLVGEGVESLNGQIWFGAECLAAGSTITNNPAESNYLQQIANNLSTTLEQIRYNLRSCCDYLPKMPKIPKELIRRLESFDQLFTAFEYDYVKAMLPIKSADDIESLQELTYLFCETLSYSLRRGLISKEDVEGCQPSVMIALPRLSIVRGLLHGYGSVVCKLNPEELSSILRPYHSLLLKFHEFLINLDEEETDFLEQLLSTNYQNNDLSDKSDILHERSLNPDDINDQVNLLNYYNKFMKCAKKFQAAQTVDSSSVRCNKVQPINRCISSSVDLLTYSRAEDNTHSGAFNRYSPLRPNKVMFRSLSLPNMCLRTELIVFNSRPVHIKSNKTRLLIKCTEQRSSTSSDTFNSDSTNSSLSTCSTSNSYPNISLITSTSGSSISNEIDFISQFKEILKRSHRSSVAKYWSGEAATAGRSLSSNCPPMASRWRHSAEGHRGDGGQLRAVTTTGQLRDSAQGHYLSNLYAPTPTTSAFSNHSTHLDLESIHFDEISQLFICKRKILHQVFVMISKIADNFQTTYACELRNILRTVFLLEEIEESEQLVKQMKKTNLDSYIRPIDVQLAHYSNDNVDLDTVEEGIDANNFLIDNESRSFIQYDESASQQSSQQGHPSDGNCDIISGDVLPKGRQDCLSESTHPSEHFISSSYHSMKEPVNEASGQPSMSSMSSGNKIYGQSLPTLMDSNPVNDCSVGSSSSMISLSVSHSNQSQQTVSTATTVEERLSEEVPTFFLPPSVSFDSRPCFAQSMVPLPESQNGGQASSSTTTGHNLLLPPPWIPDEYSSQCKLCLQVFTLIRRRHHCRRCGHIFCHQCSNNFVSLKCFGYAKPVRVCDTCLLLHVQQSSNAASPSPTTMTSTAPTNSTTSYDA